jgi:hypothetical protein
MLYKTKIARCFNSARVFVVAAGVIGLGIVCFLGVPVVVKQMDAWMLLPREQRFTELYFSDLHNIPNSAVSGAKLDVVFTLHNLEHADVAYNYKIIAVTSDNRVVQVLDAGDINLGNNQFIRTERTITIPPVDDTSVGIRVDLEYQGIAFGSTAPSLEKQSIQYWIKLAGKRTNEAA